MYVIEVANRQQAVGNVSEMQHVFRYLLFTLLDPLLAVFVLAPFVLTQEDKQTAMYYSAVYLPSSFSTTEARREAASGRQQQSFNSKDYCC